MHKIQKMSCTPSVRSRYTLKRKRLNSAKSATLKKKKVFLSNSEFFAGVSTNYELGKDFLREMDTPICTSNTVFLPVKFSDVAPGRCLTLSPYGHSSVLGFHCQECKPDSSSGFTQAQQSAESNELLSVNLCFLNNVEKVVQHKAFYLSLLGHSMNTVKQSLGQPSLLYCYTVLKKFYPQIFPIFTANGPMLTMYIIFTSLTLHVSEAVLRILTDNVENHNLSADCYKGHYILSIEPQALEESNLNVCVTKICDLVAQLDFSDELKQEYVNGSTLIANFLN
ncbi:ORF69 [Alcelaphine gammaherpesvirus 1]|uniref:Nuclear egress protein 1 n=1 Tax=Alcelaphine herpesvirus 1 (strain C500) TaxID=654901 RepID=NEC1_ALHV1|nr:ORF69 [Alcelaphine gammaherpesvirus 1]O36420.1 RecName: Full=Nuclear egress protein 1 [Alcelaphine herpesvirus 1 strain C500]AAC58117.1 ORF69 [Alcelaphine gammaherpesvirus 1]APB09493.1 nuclear egress lamina protein [Alcelaphine gammaherpesvirus 1]APB09565.1 nuclear egress lamina protein [Alcelaphine gammaherpesvirus 1]ATI21956.1 ORF69 [Alcelaphine gammaherpesvirus 1]QDY92304.1 nuclear egress lamina protein [Alcelaphine gammaherpesvirus 1]